MPKLTLVGAGPGDPDLITLKAIKALKCADVVLYDALANDELLEYCQPHCEKIYVGKRSCKTSISQSSINVLIVEKALSSEHVVRLKGGDPFVFGRGMEEIEYAQSYGIETEYIPGISSAVGIAGLLNIPLTARGVSESFWVITGTKSDHSLSEDIFIALHTSATVVVLMGMNKLEQIAAAYTSAGKGNLPVAIIQEGSTPHQQIAIGTAQDLPSLANKYQLSNPAIIVLGEVVKFANTKAPSQKLLSKRPK
jgi:uroporphyrin-III C-methyltransferase